MFLSSEGCTVAQPLKVAIELPARPTYETCPDKPDVQGQVLNGNVILDITDALRLRDWIVAYEVCTKSNAAIAEGHIEKLENRLKAFGG